MTEYILYMIISIIFFIIVGSSFIKNNSKTLKLDVPYNHLLNSNNNINNDDNFRKHNMEHFKSNLSSINKNLTLFRNKINEILEHNSENKYKLKYDKTDCKYSNCMYKNEFNKDYHEKKIHSNYILLYTYINKYNISINKDEILSLLKNINELKKNKKIKNIELGKHQYNGKNIIYIPEHIKCPMNDKIMYFLLELDEHKFYEFVYISIYLVHLTLYFINENRHKFIFDNLCSLLGIIFLSYSNKTEQKISYRDFLNLHISENVYKNGGHDKRLDNIDSEYKSIYHFIYEYNGSLDELLGILISSENKKSFVNKLIKLFEINNKYHNKNGFV